MAETEANKPTWQKRAGTISGSEFQNTNKTKDGREFKRPSLVLQKSWKKSGTEDWERRQIPVSNVEEADKMITILRFWKEHVYLKEE